MSHLAHSAAQDRPIRGCLRPAAPVRRLITAALVMATVALGRLPAGADQSGARLSQPLSTPGMHADSANAPANVGPGAKPPANRQAAANQPMRPGHRPQEACCLHAG